MAAQTLRRVAATGLALVALETGALLWAQSTVDTDTGSNGDNVAWARDGGKGAHNGTNKDHHSDNRDGGKHLVY